MSELAAEPNQAAIRGSTPPSRWSFFCGCRMRLSSSMLKSPTDESADPVGVRILLDQEPAEAAHQGAGRVLGARAGELDLDPDRAHPALRVVEDRRAGELDLGRDEGRRLRHRVLRSAFSRANGAPPLQFRPGRTRPGGGPAGGRSGTSPAMDMPRHRIRERAAWTAELRATLALSWPLILTNVAQNGLLTADVVLTGWLGPQALAAGALGTNLYFAFLIFGIGLMSATSPLIAEELGRNRFAVREVRRTVRQGLWAALTIAVPIWLVAWNGERILLGDRAGARPGAGRGGLHPRPAMEPRAVPVLPRPALLPGGAGAARMAARRRHPRAAGEYRGGLGADVRGARASRRSASSAPASPRRCRAASCSRASRSSASSTGASGATACSAASGAPTGRATASSGGSASRSA